MSEGLVIVVCKTSKGEDIMTVEQAVDGHRAKP